MKSRDFYALMGSGALFLIMLLIYLPVLVAEEVDVIYVDADSCGYEVSVALSRNYRELRGLSTRYWENILIRDKTLVVVLYTNISPIDAYRELHRLLDEVKAYQGIVEVIATDVVSGYVDYPIEVVIDSEDIWMYCLHGDMEALNRIAQVIRRNIRSSEGFNMGLTASYYVVVAAAALTGITLSISDRTRDAVNKALKAILLLKFMLIVLGLKITREDALGHPLRSEIYKLIVENTCIAFPEIQRKLQLSRATLEWHISLLLRAGLIKEVKKNKTRHYVVNGYISEPICTSN